MNILKNRILRLLRDLLRTVSFDVRLLRRVRAGDPLAVSLSRDGYVVLPGFVESDVCDKIYRGVTELVPQSQEPGRWKVTGRAEAVIRDSHDGRSSYDTGMVDIFNVDDALCDLPEMRQFGANSYVQSIINGACKADCHAENVNAYVNRGVGNTRCMHCDTLAGSQYKSFIYLTDVNEPKDGPYTYVIASHRASPYRYVNILWNALRGYPSTDMRAFPGGKRVIFQAPKGTLIITDQRGFHGGMPQAKGRERVLLVSNWRAESGA